MLVDQFQAQATRYHVRFRFLHLCHKSSLLGLLQVAQHSCCASRSWQSSACQTLEWSHPDETEHSARWARPKSATFSQARSWDSFHCLLEVVKPTTKIHTLPKISKRILLLPLGSAMVHIPTSSPGFLAASHLGRDCHTVALLQHSLKHQYSRRTPAWQFWPQDID